MRSVSARGGVENHVWVRVEGFDKVHAIADEDLERSNDEKTASVHFLRFEPSGEMHAALRAGVVLAVRVDHRHYSATVAITDSQMKPSLVSDFQEH